MKNKINWYNDVVEKDFNTLEQMTTKYNYKLGVFLFIGKTLSEIKADLLTIKSDIPFTNSKIHVICVKGKKFESSPLNSILCN